jgi:hypothetical protein
MTEFISDIKTIPYGNKIVYETLVDMNNLEKVKHYFQSDVIENFTSDNNSCSFSIQNMGKVRFSIIDREPIKTIKLVSDQFPIELNMWIQFKETGERETKMKLTLKAALSPFIKPMLSKPLQDGINQIAEVLASIPYETLG